MPIRNDSELGGAIDRQLLDPDFYEMQNPQEKEIDDERDHQEDSGRDRARQGKEQGERTMLKNLGPYNVHINVTRELRKRAFMRALRRVLRAIKQRRKRI